ncbi:MAG: hypothetical protein U5O16_25730 [Rhodococcus sp. (in: high G+C Gram-positive bacteria)]|uniref:hypothetical protein n=1 Tax=Rhodococcus sp. TaxID=1831 RepID=UPI002ADAA242|nr:hypothetical protein [Rhodococcus sp. (in: high G+C Gram-positive bacteria)]
MAYVKVGLGKTHQPKEPHALHAPPHSYDERARNGHPMTLFVIGAGAVGALILLTSKGSGLDFDRRSVSTAYESRPARLFRRTRRHRSTS